MVCSATEGVIRRVDVRVRWGTSRSRARSEPVGPALLLAIAGGFQNERSANRTAAAGSALLRLIVLVLVLYRGLLDRLFLYKSPDTHSGTHGVESRAQFWP